METTCGVLIEHNSGEDGIRVWVSYKDAVNASVMLNPKEAKENT